MTRGTAWRAALAGLLLVAGMGAGVGAGGASADQRTPRAPEDRLQAALLRALEAERFPDRLTPARGDVDGGRTRFFSDALQCLGPRKIYDSSNCVVGGDAARHSLVVIGDSVSTAYLPGIVAAMQPRGWRVHGIALHSCPTGDVQVDLAFNPPDSRRCNSGHDKVYAQVRRLDPDLVVIADSSAGIQRLASGRRGAEARVEWRLGLVRAIRAISAPGRRVVVLAPNVLGPAPGSCATPSDCVTHPQSFWFDKRTADRAAARQTHATYVDTLDWFCYQDACPAFAEGRTMRWDSAHLTGAYSRLLTGRLRTVLLAALSAPETTEPQWR